ncbi:MAG: pilus assembly protein [Gemmatimonadetes bacterium]|nr:pilus assembly protein [Gemmatimonadota bacterium]
MRLPPRLRCELGQSAVEFALVVPLFLAMICGIVEFSRLYYVRLTVREITQEATRFAVTGQQLTDPATGKPMPRAASILGVIQKSADDRRVTVDSVRINPTDGGKPGEVVQVRVFYNYSFTLAPLRTLLPTTPFYFSVGSSMKNEPAFN